MSARGFRRGCGCALGVVGAFVVFVVATAVWDHVSDERLTAANHRRAEQQIAAMKAYFVRQLDARGHHAVLSDTELWTIAHDTQDRSFGGASGVMAQGLLVLEPVTRGKDLTFDIEVRAIYRVRGAFVSGSGEDDRCFRARIPGGGGSAQAITVSALASCPAGDVLAPPEGPQPSGTP